MHRSRRVFASRGRESAGAIWRRREAGRFSGLDRGGSGAVFHYYFRATGTRWEGKTRKIRPSGGDLRSFRQVAGRSVQDCGKVVQKLAQREDENHKLCTTLCAPLRLGTRIVQVSFPLGVWCVGVVVRRCAIRSFSLPPAETGFPFRRRGRGRRPAAAGRAHGLWRGWPCALPPLRTVIRHTSDIVRHTSGMVRHTSGVVRHTGGVVRHTSGVVRHTSGVVRHNKRHCSARKRHCSARKRHCSARKRHWSAHRRHCSAQQAALVGTQAALFGTQAALFGTARGCVRLCLPPSPTLRTAARDAVPQRREGEPYIIYTRAQARGRERFAQGGEQRCG